MSKCSRNRVFWRLKQNKRRVKPRSNHVSEVFMISSQLLFCQKVSGLLDLINIKLNFKSDISKWSTFAGFKSLIDDDNWLLARIYKSSASYSEHWKKDVDLENLNLIHCDSLFSTKNAFGLQDRIVPFAPVEIPSFA